MSTEREEGHDSGKSENAIRLPEEKSLSYLVCMLKVIQGDNDRRLYFPEFGIKFHVA
ncbi:MAG: hypothetical protein R6V84_06895 [Desulfobacterales bacterium]